MVECDDDCYDDDDCIGREERWRKQGCLAISVQPGMVRDVTEGVVLCFGGAVLCRCGRWMTDWLPSLLSATDLDRNTTMVVMMVVKMGGMMPADTSST